MPRVNFNGNVRGTPQWMKDFPSRDHLVPFPAKVNQALFTDGLAYTVKLSAAASGGTDEVVTLTIDATGGTFTLTFGGQTTAAIAENATAATVQAALEALSTIGAGNVQVVGSAGGPYTIIFRGSLGRQDVGAITTDATLLTGGASTATVAVAQAGANAATSLSVDALPVALKAGTLLPFSNGVTAKVAVDAAKGATTVTVDEISGSIPNDTEASYSRYGRKFIPSGTYVGRTYAERDSEDPFGPIDEDDEERFLIAFDIVVDTDINGYADCELYRHGSTVAENFLPDWEAIEADAAILALLRADYLCITGRD